MRTDKILKTGLEQLVRANGRSPLHLDDTAQHKLLEYVELLLKWNKTYNLTAINDPEEIIIRHILDSLAVAPYIQGERILDVGSGAGLPGIPLALAFPEKQFVLLDSNNKKIRFLTVVIATLKLNNVTVVQKRVEQYQPKHLFDCIVTRALAAVTEIIKITQHLYNEHGILAAMKGKYPTEELQEIQKHVIVHPLKVPLLNEQRHVVIIDEMSSGKDNCSN